MHESGRNACRTAALGPERARYWLSLDCWTRAEAGVLLVALDPELLTREAQAAGGRMECELPEGLPLIQTLLERAEAVGKLAFPASPKAVIAWAMEKQLRLPEEFIPNGMEVQSGRWVFHERARFAAGQESTGVAPAQAAIPHFVTEARPRKVPPELLALDPAAPVSFRHSFPPYFATNGYTAGDYRAEIEARIERQKEGFFTLGEAAQVLADSRPGLDPRETVKRFRLAHSEGELPIHQDVSRFRLRVDETVREFRDTVEVGELDAWLRSSVGYGFPTAQASVTAEPGLDRGRRVKRAALIADNVRRWPTIERDLKDAATNGLSEAAKDGAAVGWWWERSAVEWARARAKVKDATPGLTTTIHRLRG